MITIKEVEKNGVEAFHRISMRGQIESIITNEKVNALNFEEVCQIAKDKLKIKDTRKVRMSLYNLLRDEKIKRRIIVEKDKPTAYYYA